MHCPTWFGKSGQCIVPNDLKNMAKGKKQTASDLLRRYSAETVSLAQATAEAPTPTAEHAAENQAAKQRKALLEILRRNVGAVVMLPLELLTIEENVRRSVDEQAPEFLSLVDSVRQNGIRQNIVVELQDADEANFKVVVIAGQRRTLAGKAAGVSKVAALVLRLRGRGERLAEGLAENLLREDLHCLDQAEAYAALLEEGWSQTEIAEKFDRRRRTILQFLRLARYPEAAKDLIRTHPEVFTTGLLFNKFIAKTWPNEGKLLAALQKVVFGGHLAAKAGSVTPPRLNKTLSRLAQSVNRYNGLNCKIQGNEEVGRITISYKNKTALEKILALFENDE
jgi:ParB/RepB/Spo0J family partition protein